MPTGILRIRRLIIRGGVLSLALLCGCATHPKLVQFTPDYYLRVTPEMKAAGSNLTIARQNRESKQAALNGLEARISDLMNSRIQHLAEASRSQNQKQFRTASTVLQQLSDNATQLEDQRKIRTADLEKAAQNLAKAEAEKEAADNAAGQAQFDSYYQDLIQKCSTVIATHNKVAAKYQDLALTAQLIGLVAGAVVAPALTTASAVGNKVWISSFAGIAGLSNTLSPTLIARISDQTQTAVQIVANVNRDLADASTIVDANKNPDWSARINALNKVSTDCSIYQVVTTSQSPGTPGGTPQQKAQSNAPAQPQANAQEDLPEAPEAAPQERDSTPPSTNGQGSVPETPHLRPQQRSTPSQDSGTQERAPEVSDTKPPDGVPATPNTSESAIAPEAGQKAGQQSFPESKTNPTPAEPQQTSPPPST